MEAGRPIDIQNDDKQIENKTKDAIASEWFKNSIDPIVILDAFISNFARDYDYKERNRFIEKSSHLIEKITAGSDEAQSLKNHFVSPFKGADSYYMYLLENILKEENISKPNYEISQKRVDAIKDVMDDLFPDYFMPLKIAYNSLLDLNKESFFELLDQKVHELK